MQSDSVYLPEGAVCSSRKAPVSVYELEEAMLCGRIIEGRAMMCDSAAMELRVEFGSFVGRIPRCEVLDGDVKDIAVITRVGKTICFCIASIEQKGTLLDIVCSRRLAQIKCRKNYISRLRVGDIVPARVTHLEQFGAFVDIGCGIVSLITVDAISVSRISHPRDRFYTGQDIYAVVKSRDAESGRIYMTHRELLGTWAENAAELTPFNTVTGVIRSIENYGIFIELAPNLAGLAEYRDGVRAGDGCSVFIKSILPDRMKVKLVLIDTHPAPSEPAPLKYKVDVAHVKHIDSWRYSPPESPRVIESVFAERARAESDIFN